MSIDDDIWALRAELRGISSTAAEAMGLIIRSRSAELDARVQHRPGPPGLFALLDGIRQLAPSDAEVALAAFTEQLGQRSAERFAVRRSSFDEAGRDPSLGQHVMGGNERAKIELRDDLVAIDWLITGARVAESVAFFTVTRYDAGAKGKPTVGTGFLVGADCVMTAYHVVAARTDPKKTPPGKDLPLQLRDTTVAFDYVGAADHEPRGTPLSIEDKLVAFDAELDYAIVKLKNKVDAKPLKLFNGKLEINDAGIARAANIVQHPVRDGVPQPKQLGLRNNAMWQIIGHKLLYFTDTRAGSSGSPVLSDGWQVIALHTGYDNVSKVNYMGRDQAFVNRGTLMAKIIESVGQQAPALKLDIA